MNREFLGYPRPDNTAGIRNHVLILPVQRQVNLLAQKIYESVPGTRVLICPGEMGRPRNDRLVFYRTLVGLGLNPNAASVLVVGSRREAGYDELKAEKIIQALSTSGKRIEVLMLADEDGFYQSLGKGIRVARAEDAAALERGYA